EHDREHLGSLGGAAWIVVTNSDHLRAAPELSEALGASVAGPAGEKDALGGSLEVARWLSDGEELVPAMKAIEMDGSKTPGELALLVENTTLVTGDLVRGHRGGALNLLPDGKLADKAKAVDSVRRLLAYEDVEAVLVGDGWPVFRDGNRRLRDLVGSLP
ncbi:MAG: MBL fold metallo-hydrolase, partial [Polyangiales bacterium]